MRYTLMRAALKLSAKIVPSANPAHSMKVARGVYHARKDFHAQVDAKQKQHALPVHMRPPCHLYRVRHVRPVTSAQIRPLTK